MIRMRHTEAGRYYAVGDTHTYLVVRGRDGWVLTISHAIEVAGVTIADPKRVPVYEAPHDTKWLAVAIAHEYDALGDDYQASEHGHRERHTEAVLLGYSTERNAA
jgi:hypothetical protein